MQLNFYSFIYHHMWWCKSEKPIQKKVRCYKPQNECALSLHVNLNLMWWQRKVNTAEWVLIERSCFNLFKVSSSAASFKPLFCFQRQSRSSVTGSLLAGKTCRSEPNRCKGAPATSPTSNPIVYFRDTLGFQIHLFGGPNCLGNKIYTYINKFCTR